MTLPGLQKILQTTGYWLNSIIEVIDMYKPDLVYSDGELPFGETGRKMLAHFYNQDIIKNAGKLEAVYTCKHLESAGKMGSGYRTWRNGLNQCRSLANRYINR